MLFAAGCTGRSSDVLSAEQSSPFDRTSVSVKGFAADVELQ